MSSNRMVGALLFKDGRVLLGHRTETRAEFAGVWDMVGGHVEQDESLAGALRRELKEELGVDVEQNSNGPSEPYLAALATAARRRSRRFPPDLLARASALPGCRSMSPWR